MTDQNQDIQFFQLMLSLHSAAMYQMGKVVSPISGKIERDLSAAKSSIDMLEMLQRKTQGNLVDDEKKLLDRILYELRMNYVDEVKRGDQTDSAEKTEAAGDAPAGETSDSSGEGPGENGAESEESV